MIEVDPNAAVSPVLAPLPVPSTSFVGREAQIAELHALLGAHRLITLTGSEGCGKTRLALQLAGVAEASYRHGACWIDLSGVTEPAELAAVPVVGRCIERRALIVLDDCEHLGPAAGAFAGQVLAECSGVKIVATSREPLGAGGELAWNVPSLTVPASGQVEGTMDTEGARLFAERARDRSLLGGDDTASIAAICRRLDGIPLAIELAAARTRTMSPSQIAERLADRFRLLTGGARTALSRQRSLEASLEWSYLLLSEAERQLLQDLARFTGSFTAGDAAVLVDLGLVHVEQNGSVPRYRLPNAVRDYARQRSLSSRVDFGNHATRVDHQHTVGDRL